MLPGQEPPLESLLVPADHVHTSSLVIFVAALHKVATEDIAGAASCEALKLLLPG